jgi:hypothetical protein
MTLFFVIFLAGMMLLMFLCGLGDEIFGEGPERRKRARARAEAVARAAAATASQRPAPRPGAGVSWDDPAGRRLVLVGVPAVLALFLMIALYAR